MYKPLVVLAVVQFCSTSAWALDFYDFVSISQPQENKDFTKVSEVSGSGHLYFSHIDRREDIRVRVRLYRPRDGEFEIVRDVVAEITGGIPSEKGTCLYKFEFKGEPPVKDGKCLLVVECTDKRQAETKWIASASQFLTIDSAPQDVPKTPPEFDRPDRDRPGNLVRIRSPEENQRFISGITNIAGIGHFGVVYLTQRD